MIAKNKNFLTRAAFWLFYTLLLAVVTACLPLVVIWSLFSGDERR